ncbi:uncharacterized protein LOC129592950 [Paramacrobiotus metropolitanus]|uniref:uncharacterized protein LOC129592950 n=1 Tax=Paramacrobiotus metropolitanus TaxID=2943436 RepID=UPI0024459CDB|nr:uncharacterized protein LOC129592950 [Paramacrobiotus metropolitanus]
MENIRAGMASSPSVMSLQYNHKPILALGILQVLFGAAMIITDIVNFNIIPTSDSLYFSLFGSGFYIGSFYIITGSLGIAAGRPLPSGQSSRSRRCLLLTTLVMSILSTIMAASLIVVLGFLLHIYFHAGDDDDSGTYCGNWKECAVLRARGKAILWSFLGLQSIILVCSLGQSVTAGINGRKMLKGNEIPQVVYLQPDVSYPQGVPEQWVPFVAE